MIEVHSALLPLTLAAIAAAAGVVQWRRARAFEDTPASKVRSAAQGYVEFSGHARALPGEPIVSPLSHRPCVWWQYRVEERSSFARRGWRLVDHGTSDAIFALEDDTGRVVIDPQGASVASLAREIWYGDEIDTPPALRRPRWIGSFGSRYRCTERLIADGQPLCAVGQFQTRRAGDEPLSLDVELAARLHDWKQHPQRLARFDLDHDGTLSPSEWEQARAAARTEILAEHREQEQQPGFNFLVRPTDRRPFVLGAGTVASIARGYRCFAALWSAAALVLLFVGAHSLTHLTR
jgi:hypothetical protein